MVGGFAPLKDVFKTDVFRLANYLNAARRRVSSSRRPRSSVRRAPSCAATSSTRTRRPYPELDPVLEAYVELDRSREELLETFPAEVVEQALALVDRAEYKRRQAPPGVKLRPRAFGRDWRPPITNRWRG